MRHEPPTFFMHGPHEPPTFFMHEPHGPHGLHASFMLLPTLVWLLLLAALIWFIVRRLSARNRPPFPPFGHQPGQPPFPPFAGPQPDQPPFPPFAGPQQPSALEILRQRYARGEIDAATFDQMRERLEASERPRE